MSKKLLIMLVAVVAGAFMASVAMAIDYGELGYVTRLTAQGKTAGTILNPEGKGDLLLAAYYDVRAVNGKNQDTYFAFINECMDGTPVGVAAKLRFREWDKSEEVFDIDIWLSTCDVWVGTLTRNTITGLTVITSPDYVIIDYENPAGTFTVSKTTAVSTGFPFITDFVPGGAYNRVNPPSGILAADLTNLGYFEVIGEEATNPHTYQASSSSPILVTRLAAGLRDCPNSLSGYVYVVRPLDGVSHGYNMDAVANFSRNLGTLFVTPGNPSPTLNNCEDGLDQLEFELSKARVYHGYSVEDSFLGQFSMIVTLPTKHFHFEKHTPYRLDYSNCSSYFAGCVSSTGLPFGGISANYGESILPKIYNRDEQTQTIGFWSPTTVLVSLPWEVNVISLYSVSVPSVPAIGVRDNVAWSSGGYQSGWLWIDLYYSAHYAIPISDAIFGHLGQAFTRYNGMPALSLALQEFSNAAAGGYYGVIFPAFYKVDWVY